MSQRILITGAASGIGLEIARAFSAAGATVLITDIGEPALAAARRQLPGLLTAVCDNSPRADIEATLPAAVDPDAWDAVMATNLTGTFHVTRLAIQSIQRFVDPKDIAALCVFLASDAGRSISGQVIPIDNDAQKAS